MDVRSLGISAGVLVWIAGALVLAQVLGDEAEMDRLQARSEEAIANGDPDTASMSIGKAALMASQLAAHQTDMTVAQWYRGAEALFRAQEHAYRALALFERAGGQTPASSGVCSSIRLAQQYIEKAVSLLTDAAPIEQGGAEPRRLQRLQPLAANWVKTIRGMIADFQCG